MRGEGDIVGFGHGCYAFEFGDAAAVRNVGLDDVDAGVGEELLEVPAGVEAFSQRYGDSC